MRLLSELPPWVGVTILLLIDVAVVSLLMAHEQRQNQKLLRSERKRLEEWSEIRAEQIAQENFTNWMIEQRIRQNRS